MNEERKKLEQERQELNTLISKGVQFEVSDVEYSDEPRFFGLIKKRVRHDVKRSFTIEEPTLATLDRLSAEWIELSIDEEEMRGKDGMCRARSLSHAHAMRCAKIVAIATMGERRLIPHPCKSGTRWVEDTKTLDELTDLFARNIKPSRLYQLVVMINAMANLGDFMNSIRLMSAERTTMPNRIEENNEG